LIYLFITRHEVYTINTLSAEGRSIKIDKTTFHKALEPTEFDDSMSKMLFISYQWLQWKNFVTRNEIN